MSATTTTAMSVKQRRVHFVSENDAVLEIETCQSYTKQEIRDSWYKPSQLQNFEMKRRNVALEWEADKSSGLYIRGLERYTKEGRERTAKTIEECLAAVMDEQDIQWANEHDDYDRFAVVSQEVSKCSVDLALVRAEKDELEAKRIYKILMPPEKHQGDPIKKNTAWKPAPSPPHDSRRKKEVVPKKEPIIVLDDDTSVNSDLSLPEMDPTWDDSFETIDGGLELLVVAQQDDGPSSATTINERNNKGTTEISLSSSRVKLEAMRLKIREISEALNTIHA